MNELNRHKRGDKIKWVITAICILLLFVMVAGLCMQMFATDDKYKPSEWFKAKNEQPNPSIPDNSADKIAMKSANGLSKLISFRAAGEMELRETFSASNKITSDNVNGKGSKWLSENNYDAFCYTVYFYVPQMYESNYYSFENSAFPERDFASVGNLGDSNNALGCFAGFLYSDYYSENNITVNCGDWSSSIGVFKLEITDQQMRICPLIYDYNDWSSVRTKTFVSNTAEYKIVKKTFLEGNLTLISEFNSGAIFESARIEESISIYENFPVKEPVPLPPNPVKEGHTFVGWYYDKALTRPYDGKPIYEDTALYAKFQINRYTVIFNSDGGSTVSNQTVNWNTTVTLTTPIKDGYDFRGWFLSDGTQYTNQTIKENTTLTAYWERNRFDITFNTDGGSAVENQQVMLNNPITLPTTTKRGYKFLGWFMPDDVQYTNQPVTDDITLIAKWEKIMCTVTFYLGDEVYLTKTVEFGTPLVTLVETANELNLSVTTVRFANGNIDGEALSNAVVTDDSFELVSEELAGIDKVVNTVKNNKWQLIGGVASGIAFIALVAAVIGGTKRKRL